MLRCSPGAGGEADPAGLPVHADQLDPGAVRPAAQVDAAPAQGGAGSERWIPVSRNSHRLDDGYDDEDLVGLLHQLAGLVLLQPGSPA